MATAVDTAAFFENRRRVAVLSEQNSVSETNADNATTEATVAMRTLRDEHESLSREITSLRSRRSNIPWKMLSVRDDLCRALGVDEYVLPFAGELLQVREGESAWEGAIERVLHGFGLSLLVSDVHYQAVAQWVDSTHTGQRLVIAA